MQEHDSIIKLDQATRMLTEVHSIDDAKDLINLAEAARVYAKQIDLGLEAQNHAAEIKLRVQWKAGSILMKMDKNKGGQAEHESYRLPGETSRNEPTYSEIGINKKQAHQWQTIASMPEDTFNEQIEIVKAKDKELTTAGIYPIAKAMIKQSKRESIADKRNDMVEDQGSRRLHCLNY